MEGESFIFEISAALKLNENENGLLFYLDVVIVKEKMAYKRL
jgi:hypothetical protein